MVDCGASEDIFGGARLDQVTGSGGPPIATTAGGALKAKAVGEQPLVWPLFITLTVGATLLMRTGLLLVARLLPLWVKISLRVQAFPLAIRQRRLLHATTQH